jgi:pyruvate formate lyase activating enzyme
MKGIISGIKRMEIHDGDGLRTTVFFKGCPLKCIWCHNPESISFGPECAFFSEKCIKCGLCGGLKNFDTERYCPTGAIHPFGREYTVDELLPLILIDEPFFKWGGGVTLSGGECLAQPDFAIAFAKALYEKGISVYVDTCGYVKRETFEKIIPYTDKFLYDIKAVNRDVHVKCTGRDNGPIIENHKLLSDKGCRVEIRYPLVKGFNDGECEAIAELVSLTPCIEKVKVLKYHNLAGSRYTALGMENTLPPAKTTAEDVTCAVNILKRYGITAECDV